MTKKPAFRHTLLAVGATLLFAACSGAATPGAVSTPAGAGPSIAPTTAAASGAAPTKAAATSAANGGTVSTEAACALVTKDAVATAAGYAITDVSGGGGTCMFQSADPGKFFAVQLMTGQAEMAPYVLVEPDSLHVAGLGDDAFWASTAGFMFVRKGDRAFLLRNPDWVMTPPTDTARLDSMTTLARTALPNL
jgi:hypothetical protein